MTLTLHGSCRCDAVRFGVESHAPVPYQRCYCSICRKAGGGGGFAVNLSGRADTLQVHGREAIVTYRAEITRDDGTRTRSEAERKFCSRCGTALWIIAPSYPDLVHPHAGAVDTDLPEPPARVHMMLGSKASWVQPDIRESDQCFDGYPEQSIEDWHKERGLWNE